MLESNLDRVLQLLLDPVNGINYRDEQGVTPLHVALRAGDQRMAEVLLLHGADPNITDSQLRTGLHYAALHDSYDMMEVVLKYTVDIFAKVRPGANIEIYVVFVVCRTILNHRGSLMK